MFIPVPNIFHPGSKRSQIPDSASASNNLKVDGNEK
jgi:hypothetical protein